MSYARTRPVLCDHHAAPWKSWSRRSRSASVAMAMTVGLAISASAGDPAPASIDPVPAAAAAPPSSSTSHTSELHFELSADENLPASDELGRRARSVSKVAVADRVSVVGHIERREADHLVVVGRRVRTDMAIVRGGGRTELQRGSLVAVTGTGSAGGDVVADKIELVASRDPALWSKLTPELVKFKKKYWKKAKKYDDEELHAYIESIVERLLPGYIGPAEFEVAVVENPDLNAFALPDGDLVLHTGIIARMENEAQLASVIAHEMAHVTQRHTLRAMGKSTEHKILGLGSLLAAIALGATGKGDAAQGVQLMSSAWLSGYNRGHEDEADRVGLRYLYLAGYDVRQAPTVWRTFRRLYGPQSREANFFYGSHSIPRDREHNLSQEVWKAYEPSGLVGGDTGAHRFVRRTNKLLRDNAMMDLARGNVAWAEWALMKSLAVAPNDADTHVAMAELALERGGRNALDDAVDSLEHAIHLDPSNAVAHRDLGLLLHKRREHDLARNALERYLELEPEAEDAENIRAILARI